MAVVGEHPADEADKRKNPRGNTRAKYRQGGEIAVIHRFDDGRVFTHNNQ